MASISINASMQRACSSRHVTSKQQSQARPVRSLGTKQATPSIAPNIEGQKGLHIAEKHVKPTVVEKSKETMDEIKRNIETEPSISKFFDERWKNGTWDLKMFIKNGKMDWDGVIVAEARRRKFLELYPEVLIEQDPVLFRTSIIPWWAWMMHSHLPRGRAAQWTSCNGGILHVLFCGRVNGA